MQSPMHIYYNTFYSIIVVRVRQQTDIILLYGGISSAICDHLIIREVQKKRVQKIQRHDNKQAGISEVKQK